MTESKGDIVRNVPFLEKEGTMRTLIRNGTVVTSVNEYEADIYIEDGIIKEIGKNISRDAEEIIHAEGKLIFPGGVDEHVHYGSFGGRLFETTDAAAAGGTTTIVDFAPQEKGVPLIDAIKKQAAKAQGTACVDFAFHGIIMDPKESVFEEIAQLPEVGVSTLKLFMAYKGTDFYSDDESILKAMMKARECGVTMMVHAENADIINVLQKKYLAEGHTEPVYHYYSRPPVAEEEATKRAIALARTADCPLYVVHVSVKEAMEAIREAYTQGYPVFGETCTHYLTLTTEYLAKPDFEGAKYVCAPPLRPQKHVDALWEAVQKGWLQAVGSDHCALEGGFETKKRGLGDFTKIPNGCPGVQDRLAMLWTEGVCKGRITRQKFIELFATMPAKVVGLYPQKGEIAAGSDADLVIFDPDYEGVIRNEDSLHGIDYSPFEGFPVKGRPEQVYLRGKKIAENGRFIGPKGEGKWQKCRPYAMCYDYFSLN
ncbi:dihydropyrimidinase [[Clostridium] hylemonae DSM 15053]|uniref:Dihydropyrimidinase n=2 Tax=[Clostridium] hylemonae TaxID=89153 RepID=C0C512_9FIRM|nr:dihydropyrimidinase [[Clostridium] hylemonae DSM 15053]